MTAISRSRGRRAVRTALAVGAVSLGLAALTACERPSPNAHFTLGSATKSMETASDCFDHGDGLGVKQALSCLTDTENVRSFATEAGETFRVGVDPDVAESGWLVFANGTPLAIEPNGTTYRTFSTDELYSVSESAGIPGTEGKFEDVVQISVVQVGGDYDQDELLEAYQAAQMGDAEAFEEALYGQFEGIWNVQLEKKEH